LGCLKFELMSFLYLNSKDFESWVEGAWKEVLSSRGEAISDGLHHSSEYEEHVYQAIKKLLKSTHESPKSLMGTKFNIYINSEKCEVELHKISSVEFGYDVPQKLLKQIITAQESSFYK
jgi:ferritin